MGDTVFARPVVLTGFRSTCADAADDLRRRAGALDGSVGAYLRVTELAYEARCRSSVPAVRAFADALGGLGSWVGRVGDAFIEGVLADGRRLLDMARLEAALPLAFRFGGAVPAVGSLVAAEAVAAGAHPRDLRAVAGVFAGSTTVGQQVVDATESSVGRAISRYLDLGAAVTRGASEAEGRWRSEAHLELPTRLGRAAFDGVVAAGGAYSGSAGGIALGNYACAPLGPPVQAVCASAGARAGTSVGGAVAEIVSDAVLGPEPSGPRPLVQDAAGQLEARIDAAAARVAEAADAHADFVLERPWLWDEEFADAPSVAPPPAPTAPEVGAAGPR